MPYNDYVLQQTLMNDLQKERQKLENIINRQIDEQSGLAINCRNCIHCDIDKRRSSFDRCLKAGGKYCDHVLLYPRLSSNLCVKYSSWSPRKKSFLELFSDKIRSIIS